MSMHFAETAYSAEQQVAMMTCQMWSCSL